ncbi:hypothetical protein [Ancylobacter pratisalsi]|uniref:Uncharacterized protein n=1 Tax=Ancylobacter pratisalsi TaxID=1745854 RepID=A0A6P1YQR4_9HYPH|nr:hypothetical protein [Ancylobacter pratisalsi]QIB35817.1 hypothetical protein G3A50_20445 [Ancylobacter pratisalsi]
MSAYFTASEAIRVANERGMSEEQARQDIIRALKFSSRPSGGRRPDFIIRFAVPVRSDRWGSWAAGPVIDWERSTLLAYPHLNHGWESFSTHARAKPLEFVILQASIDWLWPASSAVAPVAVSALRTRGKSYANDHALAIEGLEMVRNGTVSNKHQAARQQAQKAGGASEDAAVRRLLREMRKIEEGRD